MNNTNILGEMFLDSSLSESLDKTVSSEEYKERISSLLIPLLQERFKGQIPKQIIKSHHDRITFSCPYCGDSMQSAYKKRGNIILKGKFKNFFKCFNCGEFKRVDHFFKDFKTDLELDVINYISDNNGDFTTLSSNNINSSILFNLAKIEEYALDRELIKSKFNLEEVQNHSVSIWLKKRLQFQNEKFLYNPLKNYLLILNLTPSKKIIGFQKRVFQTFKSQNKYMTYKLSTIYNILNIDKKIPEDIDGISQIFGILYLNINLPITLFEGPFDSFLFRNSIANTGANKNFPIDLPIRYFYDDDVTGRKKSIEKINNQESVFLWTKFKNENNIPNRKKWDLNDMLIYGKENNIKFPLFDNYFSDNSLDILDI